MHYCAQAAVASQPDNAAEIAGLACDFVRLSRGANPPAGLSEYRVIAPELQYECSVDITL